MGKLFKVALGIILIGFGLFAVFTLLSDEPVWGSFNEEDYTIHELVYSVDEFEGLDFDLHNRDIIIRNSEDNQIKVTYYTSEDDFILVNAEGENLKLVKEVNWVFRWFSGFTQLTNPELFDVYVDLPSDAAYDLDLATSNGKLDITNYSNLGDIDFDTSNGSITLNQISSAKLDLETSNGAITLEDVDTTGAVNLYTSNGRITLTDLTSTHKVYFKSSNGSLDLNNVIAPEVEGKTSNTGITANNVVTDELDLSTSNGGIEVTIHDAKENYAVNMGTSNGSLYYDGLKVDQSNFNTSASKSIDLHSSNGTIRLNFND